RAAPLRGRLATPRQPLHEHDEHPACRHEHDDPHGFELGEPGGEREQAEEPSLEQEARPEAAHGFGGKTTSIPSSATSSGGTSDGAPLIGSTPAWLFGNPIVSRRFDSPARTIIMRSIPNAMPPCGGAPIARASSRKPNFTRCSSGERFRTSKTRCWSSASWIRNEPPPSSFPLPTRSYWEDRAADGSWSKRASQAGSGRVKGWCTACQRPSSSDHSNIGKSVIHTHSNALSSTRRSSSARRSRRLPSTRAHISGSSAAKSTVSPGAARTASSSVSERNFAIGERASPLSSQTM